MMMTLLAFARTCLMLRHCDVGCTCIAGVGWGAVGPTEILVAPAHGRCYAI